MNEKEFLEKLVDLMDIEDTITMDSTLNDIDEWDSLSLVAFLSLCTKYAKTKVNASEVREAQTVRDLYELLSRI